ncbi:MAG TPA: pyruvate kinase [Alphaproteobacteria bacterium]|nr:pyruvate kinase [Alphaproteobacteria bacterium]
MRRHRNAKIIATLGPASSDARAIEALFEAGADLFRLNFSHGQHAEHKARYDLIRAAEVKFGRPIGVIADLQGPKLRVGTFKDGEIELETGASFRLDMDASPGDATRAPLPHPEIFATLAPGQDVLINDGRVRLRVEEAGADFAQTSVVTGGPIGDRKGVNLPSAILPIAAMTEKDRRDLAFALEIGADWIALSFVQRPDDVAEAKKLIAGRAGLMAKLEKPAAVDRLGEIVDLSDAVMVARGDLGVEVPPEEVPSLQKRMVRVCRQVGKPVVVATQMLESMVNSPTPTRAEASDVAGAVYEGADAVMLSAETAVGDYPSEAVAIMSRIIARVERDPNYRAIIDAVRTSTDATAADAITAAARQVASTIHAAAIVTYTSTGSTTLRAARERPEVPILCLTPEITTARRLALAWGVHCLKTKDVKNSAQMVERAAKAALSERFAVPGDRLVITAGMPFGTPGATNLLRIAWVED